MAEVSSYRFSRKLGLILKKAGMKLALAESCTGGAITQAVTCIAGSSAWFERGFIAYSNEAKIEMLGVNSHSLDQYGAVSEEVARQMALGALKYSHADVSASITGIAGPDGGTSNKPVGTVWIGVALQNGKCECRLLFFAGGRAHVRLCATCYTVKWLYEAVVALLKSKALNHPN